MREFFRGWRRKAGCVTLAMACVFTAGWIRSLGLQDGLTFSTGHHRFRGLSSVAGEIIWAQIDETGSAVQVGYFSTTIVEDPFDRPDIRWKWRRCGFGGGHAIGDCDFWMVPYWSLILPLTLLSTYLLLVKPRPAKKAEPAPATGETHA